MKWRRRVQRFMSIAMVAYGLALEVIFDLGWAFQSEPRWTFRLSIQAVWFSGLAGLFAVDSGGD